jgi:enoyl-CoA hydratase/carnithine racemase
VAQFELIELEIEDRIATITLNRPEKMNAFTRAMKDELVTAFDQTDADDDVRAVIVTGAGRAFCAGADLSEGGQRFAPGTDGLATHRDGGGELTLRIFDSKKPVIAAINGAAIGVGLTMTLAMDARLAAETARFALPFTRRGIIPESCSSWFLPRIVGIDQALEWFYTGRTFGAQDALSRGLVRSAHSDVLAAARTLATEMIEGTAPVSVALARQLVWRMLGAAHPMEAHIAESLGMGIQGASTDANEGITSFLEKRDPVFERTVGTDLPDIFPRWSEPTFT